MKTLLTVIILFMLSGCAQNNPNLPNHKPEATFNVSEAKVKELIINRCVNKGVKVESVTDNQIICSNTMTGTNAVFTQWALGNSYSTTPVTKIRYLIFNSSGKVKVSVDGWTEVTMAYGQVRKTEHNDQKSRNAMHKILVELGGK